MCAYNYWCAGTDWATAGRPRVRPGDTILVHAGPLQVQPLRVHEQPHRQPHRAARRHLLPDRRRHGRDADRDQGAPATARSIFDGNGNFALFDVKAADYTYFEGLTFRNSEIAISAGTQFIAGAKGLTVKHSRFEDVGAGIFTNYSGSSNFYIADNCFIGRNDPNHLIGWAGDMWTTFHGVEGQIFPPAMASYVAVKLYGPGSRRRLQLHRRLSRRHQRRDLRQPGRVVAPAAGLLEGPKYPTREYWDRRPVAIDFYNNYITNFHDNPIETDGSMHNIRVMRNMLINHASHAFCNQPALGGPVYWIRNIAYHLPGGSTRLTNGSAGVVFYNNTILSETSAAPRRRTRIGATT